MPVSMPPTVKAQGNTVLVVLDTPPANPLAPTKAELNAGLFIACHLYGEGFSSAPTQNKGEAPKKFCSKVVPQQLGNTTYEIADVQYSYVPQEMGAPGAPGNEAIEALVEGVEVYVVEAPGLDAEETTTFATGDVVNIHHVEAGVQRRGRTGDGEFDEFAVTQSFVMVDGKEPIYDYVVPAA